jgi:transcriptional regulator with XRE-family HTH domain
MKERVASKFAERVWLALHALPRDMQGRPPKQVHLERQAGLSPATLSRLFGGFIQSVEPPTLAKMARVLDVDERWLGSGVGAAPTPTGVVPPLPATHYAPERVVELDDDYPHRAEAARIARDGGVADEAIASVLVDQLMAEQDPPVLWWLDRMRLRENMLHSRHLPGTPIDASTLPRPFAPRMRRE